MTPMSTTATPSNTLNALWDDFLARWPLESLRSMSLDDYTQAGNKDCFTYWLESRTEDLGSIWGGSAFKFGVYSRRDQSDKSSSTNSAWAFSPTHGWLSKYGATAEQAFEHVRGIVADVACAAREGRLDVVEAADLGHATKWKIAYLYQDRAHPQVLPIFNRAMLDALPGVQPKDSTAQVQRHLIQQMPAEQSVLSYGQALWTQAEQVVAAAVSSDEVLAYLQAYPGLVPIKAPTQKHAGFRLRDGRELCLMRARKTPVLYVQPGPWSDDLPKPPGTYALKGPADTRSHGLDANAPTLAAPNPAASFAIERRESLLELLEAYTGESAPAWRDTQPGSGTTGKAPDTAKPPQEFLRPPLNQILYGPPGTGKTYSTIEAALAILDPHYLAQQRSNRPALRARFDSLVQERRVRFVTFHQSFSYEDFVEGIRASTPEGGAVGGLTYAVERGIFGELCADAARNPEANARIGVSAAPTVWKLSISEANSKDTTRQYCLDHNEARIGWGNVGDIRLASLADPALNLGPKDRASLQNFAHEMQVGDVVLCLGSRTAVRAVGVVAGDYEYTPTVPSGVRADYVHRRAIHWLNTKLDFDITALNGGKQLTLQTVYPLSRIDWPSLERALRQAGIDLTPNTASRGDLSKNHRLKPEQAVWRLNLGKDQAGLIDEYLRGRKVYLDVPADPAIATAETPQQVLAALATYSGQKPWWMPALRQFTEAAIGDWVVATAGNDVVVAVGQITGPCGRPITMDSQVRHWRSIDWYRTQAVPADGRVSGRPFQEAPNLRELVSRVAVSPPSNLPYVLIIDEINRGNISRIFGELITLIEPSKRAGADEALEVVLPYSKTPFSVPSNVYLIGTMNTADRSLTGMDVALRRRFEFREMPPLPAELKGINVEGIEVDRLLDTMNQRIEALLDRDHRLGHAYFMPLREQRTLTKLEQIFRNQVLPLLQEYFFDDWQRIQWVLNDHRKAEDFRFVRAVTADVADLFGVDVNVTRNAQTWSINELAFKQAQSYLGVIDHRDAQDEDA